MFLHFKAVFGKQWLLNYVYTYLVHTHTHTHTHAHTHTHTLQALTWYISTTMMGSSANTFSEEDAFGRTAWAKENRNNNTTTTQYMYTHSKSFNFYHNGFI